MSAKVIAGISIGDVNGIGLEVIMKTFLDQRMYNFCTPVLYGSSTALAYHRKVLNLEQLNYQTVSNLSNLSPKTLNVFNCLDENLIVNLGAPSRKAGEYALTALDTALNDLAQANIDVLITAPVDKSQINSEKTQFTGHTEYITQYFNKEESLMFMVNDTLRIGLVTVHIPVNEIAAAISAKKITKKLQLMHESLFHDFAIERGKIAVLSLNPHSGDSGLLGKEESAQIVPGIENAQEEGILAYGPFAADGFFGSGNYHKFDAILAMYHDQGLIPFKGLSFENGVNFTAGLPVIRTSPDHGPAFSIAGKNEASEQSFRAAVFQAVEIFKHRKTYNEMSDNPVQHRVLRKERAHR